MNKNQIKFIQTVLNKNNADLIVDGIVGPATISAIKVAADIPEDWTDERCLAGYIQILTANSGIECGPFDGYWGDKKFTPSIWPNSSQKDLIRYYGQVGENQVRITLPYPHKLAWDTNKTINSYLCHEKVHDSLKRVLTRTLSHYGPAKVEQLNLNLWGGCLNVRTMRGGTTYSAHSWGIAVDYDPEHNQLKWGRDKALFAKSEYDAWWSFWKEEGWTSLGLTQNRDWMHIQAAEIKPRSVH
ncbi:hypothetical protein [Desulfovibrio gilichinskyi]|uniref:D-alanyl-D-alanine carboxypeptidase n=1 Tax=Desulfovibrio gilichinskyi TaxID=1519643 RepID=A0A1X7CDK4_9BACT|nr:hypothetical protein [Desulfovibrio gilichinskyi]SME94660.1 hypothetical protein SAMN06295933_0716 [Desulfovibrio gilichinskyi]